MLQYEKFTGKKQQGVRNPFTWRLPVHDGSGNKWHKHAKITNFQKYDLKCTNLEPRQLWKSLNLNPLFPKHLPKLGQIELLILPKCIKKKQHACKKHHTQTKTTSLAEAVYTLFLLTNKPVARIQRQQLGSRFKQLPIQRTAFISRTLSAASTSSFGNSQSFNGTRWGCKESFGGFRPLRRNAPLEQCTSNTSFLEDDFSSKITDKFKGCFHPTKANQYPGDVPEQKPSDTNKMRGGEQRIVSEITVIAIEQPGCGTSTSKFYTIPSLVGKISWTV